jgi:hypothetical protein
MAFNIYMAPTGGTTAAAPEEGALAWPVGTQPHILVVGACNPIAVPCLARLGARRGDSGSCNPRDMQLSGNLGTEGFF